MSQKDCKGHTHNNNKKENKKRNQRKKEKENTWCEFHVSLFIIVHNIQTGPLYYFPHLLL